MHISNTILLEIDTKMNEMESILEQCKLSIDSKKIKDIQLNFNDVRILLTLLQIINDRDKNIDDLFNKLHVMHTNFNMICSKK